MASDIRGYRDLVAWQKAFAIGLNVHRIARALPREEQVALGSQLRRGAVAVASNISKGYGRGSTADYIRFQKIARGCRYELDAQIQVALEMEDIDPQVHASATGQINECGRILAGLIRGVENPANDGGARCPLPVA